MILEDIANLVSLAHQKRSASELGRIFERERKAVYNIESGCTFRLDYGLIGGLSALGYELKLVEKKSGQIYTPPCALPPKQGCHIRRKSGGVCNG